MDIIEIDGASNRGIDEIRALRDSVKYAPTRGKYKVYIIDEVHMLTKESFNAFLKTLEEPPAHTIFIFATTDVHKVPLTIISRCQRFDFRRIQLDTIKTLLKKIATSEEIEIDDKTLTIIAKKADGALRDAESFFDQVVSFCGNKIDPETVAKMLNLIDDEVYFQISDAVLNKDFKGVFKVSNTVYENGWNFIDFMEGLIEHFRNIMAVTMTGKTDLVETAEVFRVRYLDYIEKFSEGDLLRILNFLNKTYQELRFTQNHKLKVEISLSHLIGLEKTSTISELISNIQQEGSGQSFFLKEKKDNVYQEKFSDGTKSRNLIPTESGKVNQIPSKVQTKTKTESIPPKPANISYLPTGQAGSFAESNLSNDSLVKKWEGFVKEITNEKQFTLGPFISSIRLNNIDGNKIQIYSSGSEWQEMFSHHEDYLNKKTLEYFGRKMQFQFGGTNKSPQSGIPLKAGQTHLISNELNQAENISQSSAKDSIENESRRSTIETIKDAIINELGGEEIK